MIIVNNAALMKLSGSSIEMNLRSLYIKHSAGKTFPSLIRKRPRKKPQTPPPPEKDPLKKTPKKKPQEKTSPPSDVPSPPPAVSPPPSADFYAAPCILKMPRLDGIVYGHHC